MVDVGGACPFPDGHEEFDLGFPAHVVAVAGVFEHALEC